MTREGALQNLEHWRNRTRSKEECIRILDSYKIKHRKMNEAGLRRKHHKSFIYETK